MAGPEAAGGIPAPCQGRVVACTKKQERHDVELAQNKDEHKDFKDTFERLWVAIKDINDKIFNEVVNRPSQKDSTTIARLYGIVGILAGFVSGVLLKVVFN